MEDDRRVVRLAQRSEARIVHLGEALSSCSSGTRGEFKLPSSLKVFPSGLRNTPPCRKRLSDFGKAMDAIKSYAVFESDFPDDAVEKDGEVVVPLVVTFWRRFAKNCRLTMRRLNRHPSKVSTRGSQNFYWERSPSGFASTTRTLAADCRGARWMVHVRPCQVQCHRERHRNDPSGIGE